MTDKPYYTPGQSDGIPPQSLTEFAPKKPLGPDPVSPMPLPEGSEIERHAQIVAFDPVSGQFKPVNWIAGKLAVDAALDASAMTIGAVEIRDRTDPAKVAAVDSDGSIHVTIVEKVNGLPLTTTISRDSVTGLVSAISEGDGTKTKTSVISRDAQLRVSSIAETIA